MTLLTNNESWILPSSVAEEQVKLRLFCYPYAGGGASVFRSWQASLPPSLEVRAIQPPGRENRLKQKAFDRLLPLVEDLATDLVNYLDKPFAILGYSLGGLVGYTLACYLRDKYNVSPVHLFLAACRGTRVINRNEPLHPLPDEQFIKLLLERYGDTIPKVIIENSELLEHFLPVIKADLAVVETSVYSQVRPLACPISVFGGLQDPSVSQADLRCWREHTSNNFKLRLFDGGHFFLRTNQAAFLKAVEADLVSYL